MNYSLTWLEPVLLGAGLKVAAQPGWKSRGRGEMGVIKGVICHHTAGPRQGNMPSLGIITNGRSDLPGPLAQLGLGRDGTFYLIAAGRANHAGRGTWGDSAAGNTSFIGIEAENAGVGDDPWPTIQVEAYARGVAAILSYVRATHDMCCGHKEYALPKGRKTDPSFDMEDFRGRIAGYIAGTLAPPAPIPAKDDQDRPTQRRDGGATPSIDQIQAKVGAPATGVFDAQTEAAVREFQRTHGLTPDGIVGPKTWAMMDQVSTAAPSGAG